MIVEFETKTKRHTMDGGHDYEIDIFNQAFINAPFALE